MMVVTALLGVCFWLVNLAVRDRADKVGYPRPVSGYFTKLGVGMTGCYALTIGTIDEGKTSHIHDINAVILFVLLFAMVNEVTATVYRIRQWNPQSFTNRSWALKIFASVANTVTWIVQLVLILTTSDNSSHVVIVEYGAYYCTMVWLASFYD
jgi:hypothetical protein